MNVKLCVPLNVLVSLFVIIMFTADTLPRSVIMVSFSATPYLLCALGDGCLLYYHLDINSGL